jgi:hypothetical protein
MAWIDKRIPHTCPKPNAELEGGKVQIGSTWQCDECKKIYQVRHDQRDGWYFTEVM